MKERPHRPALAARVRRKQLYVAVSVKEYADKQRLEPINPWRRSEVRLHCQRRLADAHQLRVWNDFRRAPPFDGGALREAR